MVEFGIDERPCAKVIDSGSEGPIYATDDWLLNSARGIEFGFEDEAAFFGLDTSEYGSGSMLLTQIYLYGFHDGVKTYPGPMPFVSPADRRSADRPSEESSATTEAARRTVSLLDGAGVVRPDRAAQWTSRGAAGTTQPQ